MSTEFSAENVAPVIGPAHYDELHEMLGMDMREGLTFGAHYEVKERHARLRERPCSEGNCVELYDPETGESDGGWGPVGCPCQDEDTPIPPAVTDGGAS